MAAAVGKNRLDPLSSSAGILCSGLFDLAAGALANGIPLVVPAATALAKLLAECGGPGTTFDQFESAAITAATCHALEHFDHFATRASAAAMQWPEMHGPMRMADDLMSLVTSPHPATEKTSLRRVHADWP